MSGLVDNTVLSKYIAYDSQVSIDVSKQVATRLNFPLPSSGDAGYNDQLYANLSDPALSDRNKIIDAQSIPGHTFDDVDKMESYLHSKFKQYSDQTDELVVLNNLLSTNQSLYNNISKEYDRTVTVRDKSTSNVQKMKQAHGIQKYAIGSMFFWANLIQFSLAFIIACVILVAMFFDPKIQLNIWVVAITASLLFLFWLFVFVLIVKQNNMRRKDDWNKFYFPTKNVNDALSCRS